MSKFDEAITRLENLRASIDEELAVVRADAAAEEAAAADKGNGGNNTPAQRDNPFFKMRDPKTGKTVPAIEERVREMILAMGTKAVNAIAANAKDAAAPNGRSITGLPLRY